MWLLNREVKRFVPKIILSFVLVQRPWCHSNLSVKAALVVGIPWQQVSHVVAQGHWRTVGVGRFMLDFISHTFNFHLGFINCCGPAV